MYLVLENNLAPKAMPQYRIGILWSGDVIELQQICHLAF
jgi:hypothetical protein